MFLRHSSGVALVKAFFPAILLTFSLSFPYVQGTGFLAHTSMVLPLSTATLSFVLTGACFVTEQKILARLYSHHLTGHPAPPNAIATWSASVKKQWLEGASEYGLSQLKKIGLQSETCFELMPDAEAVTLASKHTLALDTSMLVDVRQRFAWQIDALIFLSNYISGSEIV